MELAIERRSCLYCIEAEFIERGSAISLTWKIRTGLFVLFCLVFFLQARRQTMPYSNVFVTHSSHLFKHGLLLCLSGKGGPLSSTRKTSTSQNPASFISTDTLLFACRPDLNSELRKCLWALMSEQPDLQRQRHQAGDGMDMWSNWVASLC
ncbi:hypothetical protein SRHO_G00244670 [Serrasalmus rhombeus]